MAELWKQGAVRGEGGVQRQLAAFGERINVAYDKDYDSEGEDSAAGAAARTGSGCASSLESVARELAFVYLVALLMATMPPDAVMAQCIPAQERQDEPAGSASQAREEVEGAASRKKELTHVDMLKCARPADRPANRLPDRSMFDTLHLAAFAGSSSTVADARWSQTSSSARARLNAPPPPLPPAAPPARFAAHAHALPLCAGSTRMR